MTKKIFRSILLVASAVLLACLAVILGVLYSYFTALQEDQLSNQMLLAARGVEQGGEAYLSGLEKSEYRITWVDGGGVVRFDTQAEPATMENHAGREEIQEAVTFGVGESVRYSDTLSVKTVYLAKRLPDGSVLRVSVMQSTVLSLVLGMIQPLLIVFAFAVMLAVILARRISKRIIDPLNSIDLDKPLENDAYEELSPLLTRMALQRRQITQQVDALKRSQDEFTAITGNMNEGLVLLNEKGAVLSINPAAVAIFGASAECAGQDFLTIDRSPDIGRAITSAQSTGHSEVSFARNGRMYQMHVSRIGTGNEQNGLVLLLFDVTEKAFSERNRQEFTANVSHELKTPLQTIMGSAELIQSGFVKQEDIPDFVGRIHAEARRLLTLIEDIIRLSQLDEAQEMPWEDVDLYAISEEAIQALAPLANAKRVSLTLEGDSVTVRGVRRLMEEILFNLCDNAIKYNVAGGSVTVSVAHTEDSAVVTVSDTGIGIPQAHQSRIFERFYRVDKSHSKETGGTGLGLSIVKHAAQYLGAAVTLSSTPGTGTRITVSFPAVQNEA